METNVEIAPTPKVTQVLEHIGDVIATAQNMKKAWNLNQVEIELTCLESYVRLVRQALDKEQSKLLP